MAQARPARKRPLQQLGCLCLAQYYRACFTQSADHMGVRRSRHDVTGAAQRARQSLAVDVVLERDRHAEQRRVVAALTTPVGGVGLGECGFIADIAKRVQRRLAGVNRRERALGQFE